MSAYADSVAECLKGIEAISTGGTLADCGECPDVADVCNWSNGCDERVCYCHDEESFSWGQCDACGSTYGGGRYVGHGLIPRAPTVWDRIKAVFGRRFNALKDAELIHLDVCTDCVFYIAYGDEPEAKDWRQTP